MAADEQLVYEFGPFRLNVPERQLLRDGNTIVITDKVFELLLLLLRHAGQLMTKAELMRQLWPDAVVEENNLTVNISILRKALGDTTSRRGYIETVARRGYRFTPKVTTAETSMDEAPRIAAAAASEQRRAFVGRDQELLRLDQLLARAMGGRGRLVFVTGAPGMGKTELVNQFLAHAEPRTRAFFAAMGRSLEQYGPREAYLPFLEALRSLLTGPDSVEVARLLKQHAPTWCSQFPALSNHDSPRHDDRDGGSARMMRELSNLIEALSALKPVLLVLEDLHWADPSSCDLLRLLAERCTPIGLLIVVTLRAEQTELQKHPLRNIKRDLLAHDLCEELALSLLGKGCVSSYLDARFEPNAFPPEFSDLIANTSEGQPLFLTRLVQLLVERGDIERKGHEYQLIRPVSELKLGVPDTIRGVIERKLESLNPPDRLTLEYSSVLGHEFSSTIVARLLGEDEILLDERLDKLARAHRLVELLGEERVAEGRLTVRYRFAHVLYRAVLYEGLASKRRMVLHAKAAEAMIEQYTAPGSYSPALLALHFEAACEFERAIVYLMQAADSAGRLHARRESLEHYTKAWTLVPELPVAKHVGYQIILLYNLGWSHLNAGQPAAAIEDFEAMLEHTSSPLFTSQTPEGEQIRSLVFDYFAQPWRDAFGLYDMPRMPNQDRALGAEAVRCEAYAALCYILLREGCLDRMGVRAEEYLTCAERSQNQPRRAEALAWVAARELHLGHLSEAIRLLEESIVLSRALGHTRSLFLALFDRALVHYLKSEFELAELTYAESLRFSVEASGRVSCLLGLGRSRTHLGRISAALTALNESREIAERIGLEHFRQVLHEAFAALWLELGDWNGASREYTEAIVLARKRERIAGEIRGQIALSRAQLGLGDLRAAATCLEQAEALLEPIHESTSPSTRFRLCLDLNYARSEYFLQCGELGRAESHARALLAQATRAESPRYLALALHVLGRAHLANGNIVDALDALQAALDALAPLSAPLITWKLLVSLASARQQTGEAQLANRANRQARRLVEEVATHIHEARLRQLWLDSQDVAALLENTWS